MGVRDEEIKRLINYAKGMGVKVIIYQKTNPGAAAQWQLDGSLIEIYGGYKSKTQVILSLIHELGHHVWFIHENNRKPDMKFDEAIGRQNLSEEDDEVNPAPKHLRKKIYDVELAGTQYWETIYKDTNIKVPLWKLKADMEFDMWMYERYYETGFFPKGKAKKDKFKEVARKFRNKNS